MTALIDLLVPMIFAVSAQTTLTEVFELDPGTPARLRIDNVWGEVKVRTHARPQIIANIRETRSAGTPAMLERSRELIYLDMRPTAHGAEMIVDGVVRDRTERDGCRTCRVEYVFDVLVPENAEVSVSTVMDGDVHVIGPVSLIKATNVNGDVTARDVTGCGQYATINGRVDIQFRALPDAGVCAFSTINGPMIASLPRHSNADLSFRLSNGDIESEFEVSPLAVEPTTIIRRDRGANHYRISIPSAARIGRGGPQLTFESINGGVLIQKPRTR